MSKENLNIIDDYICEFYDEQPTYALLLEYKRYSENISLLTEERAFLLCGVLASRFYNSVFNTSF